MQAKQDMLTAKSMYRFHYYCKQFLEYNLANTNKSSSICKQRKKTLSVGKIVSSVKVYLDLAQSEVCFIVTAVLLELSQNGGKKNTISYD